MSKKWYTSDFHLYHDNIIGYCDRPFKGVYEMHCAIIEGINSTIAPDDELFILGDVSFDGPDKIGFLLDQMHGKKHLLIGNHDPEDLADYHGWQSINHYLEIMDSGQLVLLMHYPIESWKDMAKGVIHLHGHRHGVEERYDGKPSSRLREDVGVDPWDFKPVDLHVLTKKWFKEGKLV